jgi:RNA polymerase sigma-70 factor (family 1)
MKINAYQNYSNNELVALLRSSDGKAYIEIVDRHYNLLFSFAYRRVEDKEDAKDLVSDTFASLWEKHSTIGDIKNLEAYLTTMIKHKVLNHFQHHKVSRNYIENFQKYLDQYQDNADHLARHNELSRLIEKEVAALPSQMRIVFELSRGNGMTRSEIAEKLDMPENTVKTNLQRALKILKSRLPLMVYLALTLPVEDKFDGNSQVSILEQKFQKERANNDFGY